MKRGIAMTIQDMQERKKELGLSSEEIARRSGVPLSTVKKIFSGITKSPRSNTLTALERVLKPVPDIYYDIHFPSSMMLQEAAVNYGSAAPKWPESGTKQQGEYTLEDYYAIPDERRVELIDGVIYDMGSPAVIHQMILGQLFLLFQACKDEHGGNCEVFLSPCDVQLDNDNRTMLQPDLFVLCRDFDIHAKSIPGAPDLVVEILSDSTRSKDLILKNHKYWNAGVREYWIIDPKQRKVMVYFYEKTEGVPEIYPFTARIPVGISEGKCSIDFQKINDKIL